MADGDFTGTCPKPDDYPPAFVRPDTRTTEEWLAQQWADYSAWVASTPDKQERDRWLNQFDRKNNG